MGCFLTCTAKDLQQFRSVIKQSSSQKNSVNKTQRERLELEAQARREEYRSQRDAMTRLQKGDWGETALKAEMNHQYGHQVLLEHHGTSAKPGYDGVTYTKHNGKYEVHIWEAKNYTESTVRSLTAMSERRDIPNALSVVEAIREEILPANPEVAEQLIEAIQKGDIHWHIRLGPETDIKIELLEQFRTTAKLAVDVKQYTYRDMLDAKKGTWGPK